MNSSFEKSSLNDLLIYIRGFCYWAIFQLKFRQFLPLTTLLLTYIKRNCSTLHYMTWLMFECWCEVWGLHSGEDSRRGLSVLTAYSVVRYQRFGGSCCYPASIFRESQSRTPLFENVWIYSTIKINKIIEKCKDSAALIKYDEIDSLESWREMCLNIVLVQEEQLRMNMCKPVLKMEPAVLLFSFRKQIAPMNGSMESSQLIS